MSVYYFSNIDTLQNTIIDPHSHYSEAAEIDRDEVIHFNRLYAKVGKITKKHGVVWRVGQIIISILTAFAICPLFSASCRQFIKNSWKKGTSGQEEICLYVLKTLAQDLILKGCSAFLDKQWEEAFRQINLAVILEPGKALTTRGFFYTVKNRFDEALNDYNKALERNHDSVTTLLCRGELYKELDRYDDALEDFTEALKIEPTSASVLRSRGDLFCAQGLLEEAMRDYDESLYMDYNLVTLLNRVDLYRKLGRNEEALEDLSGFLAIEPGSASALRYRGNLYRQLGRLEEALEDLNGSLAVKPRSASDLHYRGDVYRQLGRLEEALEDLNSSLAIKPGSAAVLGCRENVYRQLGRLE
ncbi:putative membrane protein [Candidatus Protochlamydia naegleriophila]|uniref:Putative membrane protein n=1 Tax=Candidatus Protochlamydia naegleriophila TaxID=389348 RepID=A0A0U5JG86_9BACT|nr:tetratricopeptide repeat protein [Candidatus Protochlamydia naegleriophila]CUI16774.1 putative membrane protein [Candidatus Protochlamydia naegleriophila]